jgi:hypothetical protein
MSVICLKKNNLKRKAITVANSVYNQLLGIKLQSLSTLCSPGISGYRITLATQMIIHADVSINFIRYQKR